MTDRDVARARALVGELQELLVPLSASYGASVDVRRLEEDVRRLAADLDLLAPAAPGPAAPAEGEVVYISDEEYSPGFWADSDDEGLGAPGRR